MRAYDDIESSQGSRSHQCVKCGHESQWTQNQESLCLGGPVAIKSQLKTASRVTESTNKDVSMDTEEPLSTND
jgi:hypothetical protein